MKQLVSCAVQFSSPLDFVSYIPPQSDRTGQAERRDDARQQNMKPPAAPIPLDGKVLVITGASSGIGLCLAKRACALGGCVGGWL